MANGKYLPADNPLRVNRDRHIAEQAAIGKSQNEIASITNVSQSTVSKVLSDTKAKEIIDRTQRKIVQLAPLAAKNMIAFLTDKEDKTIRYKATSDVMKIIGVLPSHATSIFINNLMIQNNSGLQDAAFRQVAGAFLGLDDDVQDAELIEPNQDNPAS